VNLHGPAGRAYGLRADGAPVGLLLLWDARIDPDAADRADELYVWRLMIDAAQQGRGLGKQAMAWVVEEGRRMGVARIALSCVPGNEQAGRFYESLGFAYTGELKDGERVMHLPLK
jgi:RimJ/RimL family protein N-acetyltransferase